MGAVGDRTSDRLGAATGLVFAILAFASALLADLYDPAIDPGPDSSARELARLFEAHTDDLRISAYLTLLGAFFALAFGAWLRDVLARAGARVWFATLAFGGTALIATLLLFEVAFGLAARETGAYAETPELAKTWFVLSWNYANVFAPPALAVVGATTAAAWRRGILPRWLTYLSAALAAVIVALILLNMPGASVAVFALWTLLTSATLLARPPAFPLPGRGDTAGITSP